MIEVLAAAGGVMRREELLRHVERHVLHRAVHSGLILRPYPQVYALPAMVGEPLMAMRAALCFAGAGAVLSHTTALGLFGLSDLVNPVDPIHIDVGHNRRAAKRSGVVIHRRLQVEENAVRNGLPVRRLELSLVDSWIWLREREQLRRSLVLEAVGRRMTTPARILEVARGRRDLVRLLQLLKAGCRSELELWGHDKVFRNLPFLRNVPVDLGGRTVYLDLLDDATKTNVELDGRHWHTSPADRERDQRRDAALAARGYLVIRVAGARLYREPDVVLSEVAAVIAGRGGRPLDVQAQFYSNKLGLDVQRFGS